MLKVKHRIIYILLGFMSVASLAHSQDLMGFDRSSYGSVVLSQTQSVGTDIQLELSIGSYENEPIINYSSGSVFAQIGRSVGRLDVLTDKGIFPCTAFIVSEKYILTNYHCSKGLLDNEKIGASRIDATQFVAGYTQTGIEEGTKKYTVIPTPIEASKTLDYAVLEVIGDPSQEYGQLKLASTSPAGGDPFWIIGHPMGEGQRISREKCKANTPALSSGKLLHTCDTLPGNSGSPVIDAGLQQVVALHHAGSKANSVNFAILMSDILANSKVLAAYKAPLSVQQVAPKTAEITACDALYSEAKEAKACFAYEAYFKSCRNHSLAPIAEGYINEFCQVQEVTAVEAQKVESGPNCTTKNPNICSADNLCNKATKIVDGEKKWLNSFGIFEAWAKERGLTCGVGEAGALQEAKTCSAERPKECTDNQLCSWATYGRSGIRKFWQESYYTAVSEAKKRGLSCGVRQVTKTNFKLAFLSQSKLKRQQLQYALKKLGYYSFGTDGLWGKGTASGFDKFVNRNGLKGKTEAQVFSSLLAKVTVPSTFKFKPIKSKNIINLATQWMVPVSCKNKSFHAWFSFRNKKVVGGSTQYSISIRTSDQNYFYGQAQITDQKLDFNARTSGSPWMLEGSGSFNSTYTRADGDMKIGWTDSCSFIASVR